MMNYQKSLLAAFIFLTHLEVFSQNLDHLKLEPGFQISIFAANLDAPRQMVEGKNGTIFVAERGGQMVR